jgi:hypothetical protein
MVESFRESLGRLMFEGPGHITSKSGSWAFERTEQEGHSHLFLPFSWAGDKSHTEELIFPYSQEAAS